MQGVKKTTDTDRLQNSIGQVAAIVYEGTDQDDAESQPCSADGRGTSLYKRTIIELQVTATLRSLF